MNNHHIVLFFVIPLFGAFFCLLEKLNSRIKTAKPAAFISLSACLVLAALFYRTIISGTVYRTVVGSWSRVIGVTQILDGTALLGMVIIFSISLVSILFASAEKQYNSGFYFFFLILTSSMAGTLLASDLFNLFICLELTGICAYILIAYLQKDRAILASFKYLFLSAAGICFYLIGIFILYNSTGSLQIEVIRIYLLNNSINSRYIFALSAMAAGIGLRCAFIPFHTWLPDAHAFAPHPVSAVLSGVVVKISFLALWRLIVQFNIDFVQVFLMWTGSATAIYASFQALLQTDLKKLLAWSSVSQIGFIIAGFGIGTVLSVSGAMYHILNHSLFKSLLFLSIGTVIITTGEKSLNKLSGLGKKMPFLFILFLTGALSISGLPPFNGYASKKLLFEGTGSNIMLYAVLWTASVFTIAYIIKLSKIFTGTQSLTYSGSMTDNVFCYKTGYSALSILGILCLLTGLSSDTVYRIIFSLLNSNADNVTVQFWNSAGLFQILIKIICGFTLYSAAKNTKICNFEKFTNSYYTSFDLSLVLLFAGFLVIAVFGFIKYL